MAAFPRIYHIVSYSGMKPQVQQEVILMNLPQVDSKEKKVGRLQEEVPGPEMNPGCLVGVDILGEMG